MASSTERRQVVRGRPPGRAGGSSGATTAHAASLRSVSYSLSRIVRCPRDRAGRNHGGQPTASRGEPFRTPSEVSDDPEIQVVVRLGRFHCEPACNFDPVWGLIGVQN
jgi:hypothetical protein